jgi:hypothetical protein
MSRFAQRFKPDRCECSLNRLPVAPAQAELACHAFKGMQP